MTSQIMLALGLSFLAGAATSIGGLLAFIVKKDNFAALAVGLGFSAGVMLYVSFVEMLPQAQVSLKAVFGHGYGGWLAIASFFGGIGFAGVIDTFLPSHHLENDSLNKSNKLKRLGIFTAMALAIHNFPEGLATFMAAMQSPALGVSIAFAVAIHNIPEGIAVALPVYHSTGSKKKAFWYSTLSGLAEPVGAIIGFIFLKAILHEAAFGVLFAGIAGIMVYISLDELLPTAHDYGESHQVIWGVIGGLLVMAVSLQLL